MKWDEGHDSRDVVDRRGEPAIGGGGGNAIFALLPLIARSRFGLAGVIVFVIGVLAFQMLTRSGEQASRGAPAAGAHGAPADREARFVGFVLDDAQQTWTSELAARGRDYRRAKLVLFTDATQTGCGYGDAATGPFYCPQDERVYIDLGFYRELSDRFGAAGDFAQAYVIAHEIGHHVQHLLGLDERARRLGGGLQEGATGSSVRLELQADCFAGVWAHAAQSRQMLEAGDIEEALTAASAIGDDRLQKQGRGRVQPETFTHGSSAQRARWFRTGLTRGQLEACDTFAASSL